MGVVGEKIFHKKGTETLTKLKEQGNSFFDFTINDIDGNPIALKSYKNKAKCLTSTNYQQLVSLYQKYKSKGLEILAFPCNQFFSQQNGNHKQIKKFVEENFNVSFPVFQKIEVNGVNTHPLYEYLRKNSELYEPETKTSKVIPWNFAKFILDHEGHVIKFAGPNVQPNQLIPIIQKQLSREL